MKVRVETTNRFDYPDLLVICDPRDRETRYYKQYPKLIIEILSDSTEAFDRGDKFHHYQALTSLQEHVLVNPTNHKLTYYVAPAIACGTSRPTMQTTPFGFKV